MSFDPNPWQQAHWDGRAAGNFMAGGAGSGLIIATASSSAVGATRIALLLAGLALVAVGLFCVWLEIGRPWRAMNVFRHPQRSWMTREAMVAALLFPLTLVVAFVAPDLSWLAALLALAFVYCQGRMLVAARGIAAWRAPLTLPLIVATGLAEGMGLFVAATAARGIDTAALTALAVVVLLRAAAWMLYRARVVPALAPKARAELSSAGTVLVIAGTVLPLAALAGAAVSGGPTPAAMALVLAGGGAAALAGSWFKYVLITRAAFNQGFALVRLPIRGARRSD